MKLFYLLLILCFVLGVFCEEEVKENTERDILARSKKVGLAWPYWKNGAPSNNEMYALADPKWGSRVSWLYTWSVWNFKAAEQMNLEFVPMFWGEKVLNEFNSAKSQGLFNKASIKHVLGFNEPDLPGQALMSVQRAVQLWKQHLQPLKAARPFYIKAGESEKVRETLEKGLHKDFPEATVVWRGSTKDCRDVMAEKLKATKEEL